MQANISVLVVEDDADINGLLCSILTKNGYTVRPAYSGTEAKMCLEQNNYDIVLLDLMLPGVSGEDLIKEIRCIKIMPIIVISAKTSPQDKVNVLKIGADDFVSKPFDIHEVVARVEAQIRRYKQFGPDNSKDHKRTYKNIILDSEAREVNVNGKPLPLTLREYTMLELLMSHPRKVFTRANIFETVWGSEFLGDDNTINVHMSNLRTKIAQLDPETKYIQTIWGIGFKLQE